MGKVHPSLTQNWWW